MSEQVEEIAAHIQDTREALRANVTALEDKLKVVTDWRGLCKRYPAAMMGAAFGAGILLAAMTRGRGGKRAPPTPLAEPGTATTSPPVTDRKDSGVTRQVWEPVRDALIGVAVMRASAFLEQMLGGAAEVPKRKDDTRSEQASGSHEAQG